MKYQVELTETRRAYVEIEAESAPEAERIAVRPAYNDCGIVV